VITGKVRFSYAHVFEPNAMEGNDPKYSVSVIIPKSDKATLDKIEKAVEEAKEAGKAKWGGKIPATLKLPLRDGDTERPDDEVYAGSYFLNASSPNRPGLVDKDMNDIISKEEFYSGCYGRASINFYAFAVSGSRGIAAGLNNLQKLEDGERLSGGASAQDDFGSDSDDIL
ncbi:MAG: DUF2815 family protein, partial [Fusobacteriaceae bacterium]